MQTQRSQSNDEAQPGRKQSIFRRRPRRHRWRVLLFGVVTLLAAAAIALCLWWLRPTGTHVEPDPALYPVKGIDISAHNGDVDFERVRDAGVEFVYLKATEGHSFKDKRFIANYNAARRAGLKVGVYHFFRFDCTGYMQALNLLHSLKGRPVDLPVVIDIEEWTNPRDHATPDVLLRLNAMVNTLEEHGCNVMLYSNLDGFERFLSDRFAHYPLWICSFTGRPEANALRLWQYTHTGRIDGVSGPVDINVYAGDLEEFDAFINETKR